jgi:FMN phosphatase YigB (HAD superfamily)
LQFATIEQEAKMPIKAVLFDFMGTCLDWHSSIVSALPSQLPESTRSEFALEWRQTYFEYNDSRREKGEKPEVRLST